MRAKILEWSYLEGENYYIGGNRFVDLDEMLIWEGDYTITRRSQALSLLGYRYITGNLIIRSRAVTELRGLENLTYIGGDLVVRNTLLRNLDNLSGVVSIGGNLRIEGNSELKVPDDMVSFARRVRDVTVSRREWSLERKARVNLGGLSSLSTVGGDLYVGDNCSLRSLQGMGGLTSVGGSVCVWMNDNLENVDGLSTLTTVGGHLEIWGNRSLRNLDGLIELTAVGGDLSIGLGDFGNDVLSSIDGLQNLQSIGGNLSIRGNGALRNMSGLTNLAAIGGNLFIVDNGALTELDGLSNLSHVRGTSIEIVDNDHLSECEAESLRRYLETRGFEGDACIDCNNRRWA